MTDVIDDSQHDTARRQMEAMIAGMRRPKVGAGTDDERLAAVAWRAVNVPLRESSGAQPSGEAEGAVHLESGAKVGRYVVLRVLGAGGMGVVYAAYDPELDRRIALKLVAPGMADEDGRTRLLREAQALAKLSHRNVVAIHDVGTTGEQVWLAMELVRGQTLREWLRERRPWRDVLEVVREAGQGLAAAHAAGLLHRDFKPDNVMIGSDGQVRVMDFGLARARPSVVFDPDGPTPREVPLVSALALGVTQAGALVGTPRYMAPEQLLGREATAAVDQFALCVTLWEALYGERPFVGETLDELLEAVIRGKLRRPARGRGVPGWLRRVCERGLRFEVEQRFSSMEALLDALAKGRARARVRMVVVAAGALAVAGLGVEGHRRLELAQREAACEASGDEIAAAWSEERKRAAHDAILATGVSYAPTTAEKVMPWLDRQAAEWRDARVEACLDANVSGRWDTMTLDRSLWCLDERRMQLESLVDELVHADAQVVRKAVLSATGLATVAPCRDEDSLAMGESPPDGGRQAVRAVRMDLVRAGSFQRAYRLEKGLSLAREALARAEEIGWAPLSAAARYRVGSLLTEKGAHEEAERVLEDAYFEALRGGSPEVSFLAATHLIRTVGSDPSRHADGHRWGRFAEAALADVHDGERLRLARMHTNLANLYENGAHYEEARSRNEQALAIREAALGSSHPSLAVNINNLGNIHQIMGAFDEAKAQYERALAIRISTIGLEHPETASSLSNLASVHQAVGDYDEARALNEKALAIREAALGPDHPDVAIIVNNLGNVHASLGAYEEAKACYLRALDIRERALGLEHAQLAPNLINLAAVYDATESYEEAVRLYERALAIREKALGPEHPRLAIILIGLADAHRATGSYERASEGYQRALSLLEEKLTPDHPDLVFPLEGLAELALIRHEASQAIRFAERALSIQEQRSTSPSSVAETSFVLAKALWEAPPGLGGDRARASTLARQARDVFREAGEARTKDLAEVEQWLRDHGETP